MADLVDRILVPEDAVRRLRTNHHRLLPVVRTEFNPLNNRVTTLHTSMSGLRCELKDEIKKLRKEFKSDIAELRTALKGDIHALQDDVSAILKSLTNKTWPARTDQPDQWD